MPEVSETEFLSSCTVSFLSPCQSLHPHRGQFNIQIRIPNLFGRGNTTVGNHEQNCCSVAFLQIDTFYDCIHRPESYNHLAQHNKQHRRKVVLLSGVHVNGDLLSHYASLSDFKGKNIFGAMTFKQLIFLHMCFCSKETPENKRTTCYDIEVEVVSNC